MPKPMVGQNVICNGHDGTITKVHTGQLAGMVDVRLERGSVCVPYSYPDCYANTCPTCDSADRNSHRIVDSGGTCCDRWHSKRSKGSRSYSYDHV
jgi:hypothetical protein